MPPLSFSFHYRTNRVSPEGVIQIFQVPDIEHSRRILPTKRRHGDNYLSVLVGRIKRCFPDYDHIRRAVLEDVVVPELVPPRIRAFIQETLRVIYAEGQSQGGHESEEEGEYDYTMDDDNNDDNDNDDNNDNDNDGTDGEDEYGNQTDAQVDYSASTLEMNASLSVQPLNPTPVEYADPRPSRTRSFFALPVYMDEERNVRSMEQSSWMVFRVCESGGITLETGTWIPHFIHERSYGIIRHDKAARFVKSFGAILLSKARWFRDSVRNTSSSTDPAPMSDQTLAVRYLCRELRLENADDFEPYLQRIIEELEKSVSTYTGTSTSTEEQQAKSSALLCHLDQESNAMDVDDNNESGAYLTTDRRGRQHHVCKHHYKRLYPRYTPGHVETQTNGTASYELLTGKITAALTSQAALTDLLRIDPDQVGFVSESVITMDWKASMDDISRLLEFAARFGIAAMTVSGRAREEAPVTSEQVLAETNYVRDLLKTTVANLTRVTVNWDSELDVSALLKEMSETREELLYLAIGDSRLEVLSVIYKRHLVVTRIKSALGDLPSVSGASFLSGKAQSLEISSGVNWSNQTRTEIRETFKKTIQESPALTSLVVECSATSAAFKGVVKAIDEIVRPLNAGSAPRLKFGNLIVKNSTDNDVVAIYDLRQSSQDLSITPLAMDVTVRSTAGLDSISRSLGASVRVLHLIGPTHGCIENLIVVSEHLPDHLVSLTLLLDHVRKKHMESLAKLLVSSEKTFKQLALISQPTDMDSRKVMLSTLRTLQGFQVLLTRTAATDDEWIAEVTEAVHASSDSTVTIVESAKELAQKVPGFTNAGINRVKDIINRSQPMDAPSDDPLASSVKSVASSPTSSISPAGRGE
ncbi:hypothetical protein BKA57DRAFT_142316 [Linnemannia elongata]|nr:hypothetical protein BKA57DRAFT_142316 [Linnemannia elongata]